MAEMKDSGIEWIGKIPEDWKVLKNKYNFELSKEIIGTKWVETQLLSLTKCGIKAINDGEQTGKVPASLSTYQKVKHWKIYRYKHLANLVRGGSPRPAGNPIYYYGDIPFMKVADITKDDRMYVDSCEGSIKPAGLSNTRMVNKGTLLLTNSGATLGVPKILNIDTTINDGIAAFLNLSNKLNIKFAYYSLKSKTKYFLQVAALGMGQPNLNTDIIGNTYVTIPPKYEQQKIVDFLDVKCAEIDDIIADKKKQLETLKQYKKSLIYEYVTGKKEVPDNE